VYEKAHQGFRQISNRLKDRNYLILNVEKTVFMPRSQLKKNDINYNNITIHDCDINKICDSQNCKSIKKVEKIRYLGIIFDKNLRWNLHINNLLGKLRFITYKLVKIECMVPKQTLRTIIYYALYQSNFQYGILVYY